MNVNYEEQKRRYFRVPYPDSIKPPFEEATGKRYKVVDISEKGLKIEALDDPDLKVGMKVGGTVLFHNKTSVKVVGRILRVDPNGAAIELEKSINVGNLLREQSFIRKKFPMFLMDKSRLG